MQTDGAHTWKGWEAWFDGAIEPVNPGGHASYGATVKRDGITVHTESGYVGQGSHLSNNCAEYAGASAVLRFLLKAGATGPVTVRGDSQWIMRQLNRGTKVKRTDVLYAPFNHEAIELLRQLRKQAQVTCTWIPREQNEECDRLSKQVLIDRGIQPRDWPSYRRNREPQILLE